MTEEEMTPEEAKHILETDAEHRRAMIVDNVYPWWATMRLPLMFISGALLVLCLSVIFLAATMRVLANDRLEEFEIDACYDAYTSDASQATARVRAAATRLDSAGWTALVNQVSGEEITQEVIDTVALLAREAEDSLVADSAAIIARDNWVSEGQPLPCPVLN